MTIRFYMPEDSKDSGILFEYKTGKITAKDSGAIVEETLTGHVDQEIIKNFPKEYALFLKENEPKEEVKEPVKKDKK